MANRTMFFASACDATYGNKFLSCDSPSVITSKIFLADGLAPPAGINSSFLEFENRFRKKNKINRNPHKYHIAICK